MDAPKSRPSVTISTYFKQHGPSGALAEPGEFATKCEFSTNLFRINNLRQLNKSHLSSGISGAADPAGQQQQHRSQQQTLTGARVGPRGPLSSDLSQIRGPTGSVRGHKDVVRRSLEGIKVTYNNRYYSNIASSSTSSSCSSSFAASSLPSFSTFFARHPNNSNNNNNFHGSNLSSFTSFGSSSRANASSLALTIDNELLCSEYLERLVEEEQDLCVAYTTTLGVIRRTFEDSKRLRAILDLNLVRYEERDIYLNQEYKCQLRLRCLNDGLSSSSSSASSAQAASMAVPALFVDGVHVGGAKEVEALNESGALARLLAKFKMAQSGPRAVCHCCGNAKFIACQSCNGSRKSTIHHFKFNSVALRCIKCDNNDGLVQCPVCCGDGVGGVPPLPAPPAVVQAASSPPPVAIPISTQAVAAAAAVGQVVPAPTRELATVKILSSSLASGPVNLCPLVDQNNNNFEC